MNIICGTDFSVHANAAAVAAGSLVARLEAQLTLAYVIDPSRYVHPSADLLGYLRRTRQRRLQGLAARAGQRGAMVETRILEGSPAAKLSDLASSKSAQLLVVSARGEIAPTQWLSGSVTDQVVQMSAVPTLVMRNAESFERWLRDEQALRILVGYDFSPGSEAAIRWAASLGAIAPCEITLAYATPAPGGRRHAESKAPVSPLLDRSELKRFLEMEIDRKTRPLLGTKARIHVTIGWQRAAWELIELAADTRADLVVIGTSQRRGLMRLGSVARAVLHHFQQNVVSVPPGWIATATEPLPANGGSALRTPGRTGLLLEQECAVVA